MSKDVDGNEGTESTVTEGVDPACPTPREEWESLHSNPDDRADLGYELDEWKDIETLDGKDQVMFLPEDEDVIDDAAFIVVHSDSIRNLAEFF